MTNISIRYYNEKEVPIWTTQILRKYLGELSRPLEWTDAERMFAARDGIELAIGVELTVGLSNRVNAVLQLQGSEKREGVVGERIIQEIDAALKSGNGLPYTTYQDLYHATHRDTGPEMP